MQPAAQKSVKPLPDPFPGQSVDSVEVSHANRKKIAQAAGFDAERSVHIGLTKRQTGVCKKLRRQRLVGQSDRNGSTVTATATETPSLSTRVDNGQVTVPNQTPEQFGKQPHRHPSGSKAWKLPCVVMQFKLLIR